MSNRPSTFGGTWSRPRHDNTGHNLTELRDRASFDQAPPAGASCLLAITVSLGMWAAIIAALLHTTGVIA